MSIEALNWAFNVQIPSSGAKLVLLTLANYSNEDGAAYPSQKALALKTCLSERAVRNNLVRLEEWKLVRRIPRTRANGSYTTDLFKLDVGAVPVIEVASGDEKTQRQILPAAEIAAGETVDNPVYNSSSQRQILPNPAADSAAPEPSLNTSFTKNTLSSESTREVERFAELGVPNDLATRWMEIRKDVEQRIPLDDVMREADLAGITMPRAVEVCIARSWSSFKASWYAKLVETSAYPPQVDQQAPPWWGDTHIERLLKASGGVRWWLSSSETSKVADRIGEDRQQQGETLPAYLDRLREKLMAQWRAKVVESAGTGG